MSSGQPPEAVWAEYLPLFQAGIPIIAGLVNLDAIVKEPKVAFVGFPIALADRRRLAGTRCRTRVLSS